MSSKSIGGDKPVSLARMVPAGVAQRHSCRCRLRPSLSSPSTFLRSLRSRPVTALLGYYGRSDSCPPISETGEVSPRLLHLRTGLSDSRTRPSDPSTSKHLRVPRLARVRYPLAGRAETAPQIGDSGLRRSYAGSPHHTGRIEFVILQTGRSPPVASHHASRRDLALQRDRSYVRLQVASA
jgi:hypothetical protein